MSIHKSLHATSCYKQTIEQQHTQHQAKVKELNSQLRTQESQLAGFRHEFGELMTLLQSAQQQLQVGGKDSGHVTGPLRASGIYMPTPECNKQPKPEGPPLEIALHQLLVPGGTGTGQCVAYDRAKLQQLFEICSRYGWTGHGWDAFMYEVLHILSREPVAWLRGKLPLPSYTTMQRGTVELGHFLGARKVAHMHQATFYMEVDEGPVAKMKLLLVLATVNSTCVCLSPAAPCSTPRQPPNCSTYSALWRPWVQTSPAWPA